MGESVKIKNLIYKMIYLSGFSVRDKLNPTGDIEIKVTGLRAGEKLYEELLIGDNPQKTNHPKIQKIKDTFIPFNKLEPELNNLKNLLDNNNTYEVKNILKRLIDLYKTNSEIIDHIYVEQKSANKYRKNLSIVRDKKIVKLKQ